MYFYAESGKLMSSIWQRLRRPGSFAPAPVLSKKCGVTRPSQKSNPKDCRLVAIAPAIEQEQQSIINCDYSGLAWGFSQSTYRQIDAVFTSHYHAVGN